MASIAISSAQSPNLTLPAATGKSAPAQAETTVKTSTVLQPDTVKLSAAAQAKLMHRQGQSPALIAATLGTNVAAVDGYLNINVAKQTSAEPTPAPTEQAEPTDHVALAAQSAPTA